MAKVKNGRKGEVSKGERKSSLGVKDNMTQKMLNKLDALAKGKDVTFTIANPNKSETNKPFIKYKVSGKKYLDSLKNAENKVSAVSVSNGG